MLQPGQKYQHYKGQLYELVGIARHTETKEKMVLYKALYDCPELGPEYGTNPLFVRPFDMFHEDVTIDGTTQPRFKLLDS